MQWSEVEITDNNDKVLRGTAARRFVEINCPDAPIETILKNSIRVEKLGSKEKSTAPKDIRAVLFIHLRGKAKSLRILAGEQAIRNVLPLARAVQNVVNVVPALLQMYLDVNRDGIVDDVPANHLDWTWGNAGHGAVITVKTQNYLAATPVLERIPIEFRWQPGQLPPAWQATLSADHPNRIRVFRQQAEGAALIPLPCDFNTLGAEDAARVYRLWIEAVDFPEVAGEANWLVQLTFTLNFNGGERNRQTAVVRIAPWIMASDLDPTHRVFLRTTEGIANPLPDAIDHWVGGGSCVQFQVGADKSEKGFARDIMKSGYNAAPHFSGIVIQERLDQSSLTPMSATAAANIGGSCVIKPTGLLENQMRGQDNGGNLLVSPPSPAYPWGRILFGGNDTDKKCNSEEFYLAQRVQNPIRLDSTWLRVGHVDEMLSFVRCQDGSYRALLLSQRLAYIMLRGVASRTDASALDLINWAVGVNDLCIGDGIYTEIGLTNRIGVLPPNVPAVNPPVRYVGIPAFDANPAVPVNLDRFVVAHIIGTEFPIFMQGTPLVGQSMRNYNLAFPEGRDCYELQVHSRRFLDKANAVLLHFLGQVQPVLDGVRQTLRDDLGFTDDAIIDVPVLLNTEGDDYVALTGDSVNLLQLAGNPASRCLVPKPFGPIFLGEYVFERYLADKFAALPVAAQFLADDKFHVMEGEIHCGTNQTHPALQGARKKWWEMP